MITFIMICLGITAIGCFIAAGYMAGEAKGDEVGFKAGVEATKARYKDYYTLYAENNILWKTTGDDQRINAELQKALNELQDKYNQLLVTKKRK